MLHDMAGQGHAPRIFRRVSRHGIPWITVLVMMMAMLVAVYLNYLMPENVFLMIASLATFMGVDHDLVFANRLSPPAQARAGEGAEIPFARRRYITAGLGVVFLLFIIGLIGYFTTTRVSLYVGAVWVLLLLLGYCWVKTKRVTAC